MIPTKRDLGAIYICSETYCGMRTMCKQVSSMWKGLSN